MSALYDVSDVSLDLAAPSSGLQRLLPGPPLRMTILSGVSLSIGAGEMLGLVGESGSGKSTLARVMMGLSSITEGSLAFDGRPLVSRADFTAMRRSTALMFQDAVASLSPRRKVGPQLVEPFQINGIPLPEGEKTAAVMLERVGLPAALAQRYPHELSGGQARRVSVARALALGPKLVIADEPTAGLDVSVQAEILNLMTGLRRDLGLSFLIITHNLAVIRHVTDRVAVLYLGRLAEWGPTREVFAKPLHPYTRSLIAAEPQADPRKRRQDLALKGEIPSVLARPSGCEFHTRCPLARPRCTSEAPEPRQVEAGRMVRCHFAEDTNNKSTGGNDETFMEH
ncbi:oligopeptide/dipeptide ABC transporter ATP-binding protein [Aestuariivirga sp.]|uniref:oligopeptide/dipeptide ABC transporter ATP-binding protein n=1 Tax=Aestuariivirga sp. TaxID=2650926 RepID=UPI003BA8FCA8